MTGLREVTIDQLKEILGSIFESPVLKKRKITPETRFREDLGMDSLDQYIYGYALEENLGLSIPDGDMQGFRTMGECKDYLETH
jgi:acyl carrier protein